MLASVGAPYLASTLRLKDDGVKLAIPKMQAVSLKSSLTSKIELFKELLDSRIRVEELFKEPKYPCQ